MTAPLLVRDVRRAAEYRTGHPAMQKFIWVAPGDYAATDPLLSCVEDRVRPPGGFPSHPHRGFQTVTLVLEGRLRHTDSAGHAEVVRAGGVQWMLAARGVQHSEQPDDDDGCRFLQAWLNLPAGAKRLPPRHGAWAAANLPVHVAGTVRTTVVAGACGGVAGPLDAPHPLQIWRATSTDGGRLRSVVPPDTGLSLLVLDGHVVLDACSHEAGAIVVLDGPEHAPAALDCALSAGADVVLLGGRRIREPVAASGPFVMNTPAELAGAWDDYRHGRFDPDARAASEVH